MINKLSLLILLAFIVSGCNKSTDPGTKDKEDENEVIGYVTVAGRDVRLFTSRGETTSFVRMRNNEGIIDISGSDGKGAIHLHLVNVTSPGTYSFQFGDTAAQEISRASYSEGAADNPSLFYSSAGTNPQLLSHGAIEILELSTSHIEAKLNVMLGDTSSLSKVYLEEVLMMGDFE